MAEKKQKENAEFDLTNYTFTSCEVDPFEEYKFFAEMTDKLSGRRQQVHTIFEAILTALLALLYFLIKDAKLEWSRLLIPMLLVSILGIAICIVWHNIISNYKKLINLRFSVLMEMEKHFKKSVRMYTLEWDYFSNKNRIKEPFKFSFQEKFLPVIFGVIFLLLGIGSFFVFSFIQK